MPRHDGTLRQIKKVLKCGAVVNADCVSVFAAVFGYPGRCGYCRYCRELFIKGRSI